MSTPTITITDPAKVREADVATFTSPSGTVIGTVLQVKPFVGFGGDKEGQPAVFTVGAFDFTHDFRVDYFVSATREAIEHHAGTVGTANVRCAEGEQSLHGVWVTTKGGTYFTPFVAPDCGHNMFYGETLLDFVPDETPLPTRDDLARVMHDDYLPNGSPRLGRNAREELAAAVLRFLRGEVK
jgi:hypothetical protein